MKYNTVTATMTSVAAGKNQYQQQGNRAHQAGQQPTIARANSFAMAGKSSRLAEIPGQEPVLHKTQHHPDAGRCEAIMPIDLLAEPTADQRPERGPQIDSHVKHGETGVASRAAFRIKVADNRADVRFQ
jgi:hypothetical protein